jgi:ADP-ribosyl-[dinitrogen reductase] hydrolase
VLPQSGSLTEAVSLADSVAYIACGIAFFSDQHVKNFPYFLDQDIENRAYGKDYRIKLSEKLPYGQVT